jgi:putative hemolysin
VNDPYLELLIILLLLIANGVLSMSETAVISSRKARLQQQAEAGSLGARTALELANQPDRLLAALQIGITLIGILSGAFGGATVAGYVSVWLSAVPRIAPYAGALGVALVVILITFLSLVIGELTPKRLALNSPERIASAMARPLKLITRLAAPFAFVLSKATDGVLWLLRARPSEEPEITTEELKILVEQGRASGVFEDKEQQMIESVLRLDDRRAEAFMTPRLQIHALDIAMSTDEIREEIAASRHSRFPVIRERLDNVLGIVHAQDLLNQSLAGEPLDLEALLHPPLYVPEGMSALRVLELFRQSGSQLALVIDEYGGVQGMVTHNDLLEAIVGDLPPADEASATEAVQRPDGSWLMDGLLRIDELKSILDLDRLPNEEAHGFQTLGGFVQSQLRAIPAPGQSFEWGGWRFEVMDMDRRRVDKVLVTEVVDEV